MVIKEVKFRDEVAQCSLVIRVGMGGQGLRETVIDSGAQVTVMNTEMYHWGVMRWGWANR